MLLRLRTGSWGFACLLVTACGGGGGGGSTQSPPTFAPTATASPVPTATPTVAPTATPTSGPAVTIADGGSTNRRPFTIVVQTSGSASVTQNGMTRSGTVTSGVTAQFFTDLNNNLPVSNVPTMNGCTKSASYGTTTTLTYQGSTSHDISCPPSSMSSAQTLYNDVTQIEAQLGPFTS